MIELTALERSTLGAVLEDAKSAYSGDGPVFAAAIVKDGKMICRAMNEVAETCDPTRHAEVVAIARACQTLGTTDLTGATLISSMQPCEMCLAAMRWAGIDRVIFAAQQDSASGTFFMFPDLKIADYHIASGAAFSYLGGQGEDEVLHIYGGSV